MSEPVITYRGNDRNGATRMGGVTGSPAALVERLFRQKWRWAIAERDGIKVGGICLDEETHRRVWWAES